jgi:CRISPR-associated endoribonuclease Cas6
VAKTIAEGFLTRPDLVIGRCKARVSSVTPVGEPVFSAGFQRFRCLSPIILRTRRIADNKEIVWDLSPQETEFKESLAGNLLRRYVDYHNKSPDSSKFEVEEIRAVKRCRIRIKDTYNRAHFMEFTVNSNPALLEFAYQAGVGERNSLGFGMIEVR